MRTTVRLDEDLLWEAKAYAAATDRTPTRLSEDALREALARRKEQPARRRVRFKDRGLQPGVNLDSNAAFLDLMEGID